MKLNGRSAHRRPLPSFSAQPPQSARTLASKHPPPHTHTPIIVLEGASHFLGLDSNHCPSWLRSKGWKWGLGLNQTCVSNESKEQKPILNMSIPDVTENVRQVDDTVMTWTTETLCLLSRPPHAACWDSSPRQRVSFPRCPSIDMASSQSNYS